MFLESVFRGIFWLVFIFSIIRLCYWGILRLLTVWGQMFSEEQQGAVLGSLRGNYGSGGEVGRGHNTTTVPNWLSAQAAAQMKSADDDAPVLNSWLKIGWFGLALLWFALLWYRIAECKTAWCKTDSYSNQPTNLWQKQSFWEPSSTSSEFYLKHENWKQHCFVMQWMKFSAECQTIFWIKTKSALHLIENKTMAAFNKSTHMCTHWQNVRHW